MHQCDNQVSIALHTNETHTHTRAKRNKLSRNTRIADLRTANGLSVGVHIPQVQCATLRNVAQHIVTTCVCVGSHCILLVATNMKHRPFERIHRSECAVCTGVN